MSLHPRNAALAAVLLLLVVLNVILARPTREMSEAGSLVTFDDAQIAARIEITPADAERIVLKRVAAGDDAVWRVATEGGFRAFEYAVDELLAAVVHLGRSDRVGSESDAHALFGVGPNGTRVEVFDEEGRSLAAVIQGTHAGLATGSYVRLAASDDVYRATGFAPVGVRSEAWLDTRLIPFDVGEIRGMTVMHEEGRIFLDLLRDARGWRDLSAPGPDPVHVSRTRVERVLQVASTLVFSEIVADGVSADHGFGSPPQTLIELDLGEDDRRAVWVGFPMPIGDDGERRYYATNPGWLKSWTVALPARTAEVLFAAIDELAR